MNRSPSLVRAFAHVALIAGFIVSAVPAQAASPYGNRDMQSIDVDNAYRTPLVYVMSVSDVTVTDGKMRGTAEVMNADALGVADIGYRIEIVGKEVDAFGESLSTYWRGERVQIGALAPQERKTVAFSVPAPALPGGSYLVRVQIITSQGRPYGWGDVPFTFDGDVGVALRATGIVMEQYGTDVLDPLSGPNIDSATPFTITAIIRDVPRNMTVVPVLHMFDFDAVRDADGDVQFEPVQLKKGQNKTLSYVVTSRQTPGVTMASLILTDPQTGKQLSPLADYRWVIRGQSAHVMAIRSEQLGQKAGDELKFRVDMVGSPDAETVVSGTIALSIHDDNGTAATLVAPFTDLKDGIVSGDVTLELTRDLRGKTRIESVLRNADGAVLHTYTVPLEFSEEGEALLAASTIFPVFSAAGSALAVGGTAALLLMILMIVRNRRSFPQLVPLFNADGRARLLVRSKTALSILLMIGMLMPSVLPAYAATSNGIEVHTALYWHIGTGVELFINEPKHNQPAGTYSMNSVPFQYRLRYGVCFNVHPQAYVMARYDKNGTQCQSDTNGTNAFWVDTGYRKQFRDMNCDGGSVSGRRCLVEVGDSTTLNLSQVLTTAKTVTLQVYAKWIYNGDKYPITDFSPTGAGIIASHSEGYHVVNICLNLKSCGNGAIDVAGEECDDGNMTSGDGCSNICKNEKADVEIRKTASKSSVVKGESFTYSLTAMNRGPDVAKSVVIQDPLPADVTFLGASSPDCGLSGNTVTCNAGDLANGVSKTYTVTVQTSGAMACPGTIPNTASVSSATQDTVPGNNTASVTTNVTCLQPLCPNGQVESGEQCDDGNQTNDDACTNQCKLPRCGDSIKQYNEQCDDGNTNSGDGCSNLCQIELPPEVDVSIVKKTTGSNAVFNDGTTTFELAVTNNSPTVIAQNVVVTDPAVSGITVLGASSPSTLCTVIGGTVSCTFATLLPKKTEKITIAAKINALTPDSCTATQYTNTASVTTTTPESNLANNQDHSTVDLKCPPPVADVTVFKDTLAMDVLPGDIVDYVLFAKNLGGSPAQNVVITDTLPNQLDFVDAPGCTVNGRIVTCSIGTLGFGQSSNPILMRTRVNGTVTSGMTIVNPAHVTTASPETNTNNNDDHADVKVGQVPKIDLTITKNAPAVFNNDTTSQYDYTIVVHNNGPAAAADVVVDDDVSSKFAILGASPNCSRVPTGSNHMVCRMEPPMQSGEDRTVTITVSAPPRTVCDQTIANTAKVTTSTPETNTNNNQSSASTKFECTQQTDIKLMKTASAVALSNDAASPVNYSLTVTNTTSTPAQNVVITDTIPSPLTIVPALPTGCTQNGNAVTCTVATLGGNGSRTFVIKVSAPARSVCDQRITNTAQVTTSTQETNLQNNSTSAFTDFTCTSQETDVTITKTASATTISNDVASPFTYTLRAYNSGPAAAQNVVITDTIPAPLVVGTLPSACSKVGNAVTCNVGTLASGASSSAFVINISAPARSVCGVNDLMNTATVTTSSQETNTGNNQASAAVSFTCTNQQTDVTITKTAPTSLTNDAATPFNYVLTAINTSGTPAQNVVITDTIPQPLVLVMPLPSGCTNNGNAVTCTKATLAANASQPFTIRVSAPPFSVCGQRVTNHASITTSTQETNTGNNQTSAFTDFTCSSTDVQIVKSGPQSALFGSQIVYTLTVTNVGLAAAQNVVVKDTIPSGMTFVSATVPDLTCNNVSGEIQCSLGTLGVNQFKMITVTLTAPVAPLPCFQTSVVNMGRVETSSSDLNSVNNQSSVTTQLLCQDQTVDVTISKTGPQTALYGSQVIYSITATNSGPGTAQNVVVKDTIPSGMSYVSATGASCNTVSGEIQCVIGTLAAGQSSPLITVTLTAPALPAQCSTSSVTNTGRVETTSTESNTGNNQSSASTQFTCQTTDLTISKTGPTSATRGSTLTYSITVTNSGPASASNVILKDPFSSELTYSSFSSNTGVTCAPSGNEVQCQLGTMTSGQTIPVTLTFTVKTVTGTCSSTTIQNTANVTSSTTESNMSNNTSQTISTTLTCVSSSEISVTKTDNRTTAYPLDRLRYSIVLTNNNSTVVNSLLVTDNVPGELTIITVSDGGTINGQQARWTDISVPANSTRTLYIDVEVRGITYGTNVRNTVDVNGKQASDDTTIIVQYNPPPPPPYYPPNPPPPYYPPNPPPYYPPNPPPYYPPNPPPYYPPNPPPVYYPPNPPPPHVIYPETGTEGSDLYTAPEADGTLTKVTPKGNATSDNYSAVFYATILGLLAVGSALASRFFIFGL